MKDELADDNPVLGQRWGPGDGLTSGVLIISLPSSGQREKARGGGGGGVCKKAASVALRQTTAAATAA